MTFNNTAYCISTCVKGFQQTQSKYIVGEKVSVKLYKYTAYTQHERLEQGTDPNVGWHRPPSLSRHSVAQLKSLYKKLSHALRIIICGHSTVECKAIKTTPVHAMKAYRSSTPVQLHAFLNSD
jgi:hypothetical protein